MTGHRAHGRPLGQHGNRGWRQGRAAHPAAVRVAGGKALVDNVVTLGLPHAVSSDEFLHAMLYGSQRLMDDSQILQTYAVSATQPITGASLLLNPRLALDQTAERRSAVLGGIVGGPVVGLLVGLTGGIHRYSLGGFTALACTFSTIAEGLLGGLVHRHFVARHRLDLLFSPWVVGSVALIAELMQMGIILLVARPYDDAVHLIESIIAPMLVANTLGAAMFMRMILDHRAMLEKYSVAFSARALKIAERAMRVLDKGFTQQACQQMARILYEETGVGAVAITDREKLLAFIGIGEDHHLPGTAINSAHTFKAIQHNEVVYADGNLIPYSCNLHPQCRLGSSLVIPLRGEEGSVVGTIKLYEPKRKFFSSINRTLGEGIARLLSGQILASKYNEQKRLLAQSEIKLLQAQINPHFLFNALNTLAAVIRRDPEDARTLVHHLSTFFRKNLKRQSDEEIGRVCHER